MEHEQEARPRRNAEPMVPDLPSVTQKADREPAGRSSAAVPSSAIRIPTETRIQRSPATIGAEGGHVDTATERAIASARSGGTPLDAPLRRSMESAIGADFGRIRLHVGPKSDELSDRIQAKAFTTGSDVFVRRQDFSPGSPAGQQLIAHELVHTVQQGAAPLIDGTPELAADRQVQRMPLTDVLQRVGGGEDSEDGEDGGEIADLTAVTGDNGYEKLDEEFDLAFKAATDAVEELASLQVSNAKQIAAAKQACASAQELVQDVEDFVAVLETRMKLAAELEQAAEAAEDDDFDYELVSNFQELVPKMKSGSYKLSDSFLEASGKVGLAEDAMNQDAAQAKKLAGLRGRWASPALAKGHYDKHKSDTGAKDEEEYLVRAAALNDKDPTGTIKRRTRQGGDILTIDTSTNEFTILSDKGRIRTFFCPGDGIKYFNRQFE